MVCLYRVMAKASEWYYLLLNLRIIHPVTVANYFQASIPSNRTYEIVYNPYATLMTVYQLQAMLHLSLHLPDSKRRRQTFVETENLRGDEKPLGQWRKVVLKRTGRLRRRVDFVGAWLCRGKSYGSATNANRKHTLRTINWVNLSHVVATKAELHAEE